MGEWVCVYFDLRFARRLPRPLAAAATFFGGSGAADEGVSSTSSSSDIMAESWFRTLGVLKIKNC